MAKKIRTGIIRCDSHALWFGCLMAEHDPMRLQRPTAFRKDFAYTWQAGAVHRFFYTNYGDPTLMTAPFVGGFEIVKLWDSRREAAEQAREVFRDGPEVVDSPQQCSDDVDLVLICDCNLDGRDHVELARPGLEKGVAAFIDKPLANTSAQCRELIDLARRRGAPLFSASILRYAPAIARFKARLPEVGRVNHAIVTGGGLEPAGLVHSITFAQHLFGTGIVTVQAMAAPKQTAILLDHDGKPGTPEHGVMIHTETGDRRFPSAMGASVIGTGDDIHVLIPGGYAWPFGAARIVREIEKMLRTGSAPPIYDMVEAVAVMESVRRSIETRGAVRVENFLGAGS